MPVSTTTTMPVSTTTTMPVSPGSLGACTASGATGAGSPSYTVDVGPPASGNSEPEIAAAISKAAANGSGDVVLGAGTYDTDSALSLSSNVELSGAGEGATVIEAVEPNFSLVEVSGVSNVTLSGFTVNANAESLADVNDNQDYLVNIPNSTNVIVQEVATENPSSYSIVPDAATDFCIRNDDVTSDLNTSYTNLDGIHVEGSTHGDVVDNYVDTREDNSTDGDDGLVAQGYLSNQSDVDFVGNVVRGGNGGNCMQFAVGPDSISNDLVEGNEFWGCPFGIRTGGYADSGSVTDVTITDNNVHNLVPGAGHNAAFPGGGNAVELGGFLESGQSASGNIVSDTYVCDAGSVVAESGTTISGTVAYTVCSDAPTTTAPPPVIP
jgi:hypothetical protein